MFPSRMWRELYDALLKRQSGGRAERDVWACSPWRLNTIEKIEEKIARFGVADAGLDAMRRELDAASKVVVVDFRADLSSYDAMIAAAGKRRCVMVESDATGLLLSGFRLTTMARELEGIEERAQAGGWSSGARYANCWKPKPPSAGNAGCCVCSKTPDCPKAKRWPPWRKAAECGHPPTVGANFVKVISPRGAVNVLAFGLPGRGKTHFLSAVGYELIQRHSQRILFVPSYKLIQRLLEAKRELKLEARCSRSSMPTRRSSSTIWATCSKPARRWKCSSPSSPNDMSVKA